MNSTNQLFCFVCRRAACLCPESTAIDAKGNALSWLLALLCPEDLCYPRSIADLCYLATGSIVALGPMCLIANTTVNNLRLYKDIWKSLLVLISTAGLNAFTGFIVYSILFLLYNCYFFLHSVMPAGYITPEVSKVNEGRL